MKSLKKRGPHVLNDLNDLLFSLQNSNKYCNKGSVSFHFLC